MKLCDDCGDKEAEVAVEIFFQTVPDMKVFRRKNEVYCEECLVKHFDTTD